MPTLNSISVGVMVVVAAMSAGCFFFPNLQDPLDCGRTTSPMWHEPGVFDAFPRPGNRIGDYSIRWDNDSQGDGEARLYANNRNISSDSPISHQRLFAWESDRVSWGANARDKQNVPEDQVTRQLLEETFAELGLPYPANAPQTFEWWKSSC